MSATLTAEPAPDLAPGARQITIDCKHGTTTLTMIPPRDPAAYRPHEVACAPGALETLVGGRVQLYAAAAPAVWGRVIS
jgi:hypothetical protein